MNYLIYVSLFVCFISLLMSYIAIARVAKWRKDLAGLDWEAVATLLGDVATVKRSIVRLNGRLNGMDSPKYDVEQEINAALMKQQAAPQKARGG